MCGLRVDFAHKIGCQGNVPSEIENLTSDRSSTKQAKQSKTKEVFDEGAGYSLYATYTHSSTIHAN